MFLPGKDLVYFTQWGPSLIHQLILNHDKFGMLNKFNDISNLALTIGRFGTLDEKIDFSFKWSNVNVILSILNICYKFVVCSFLL